MRQSNLKNFAKALVEISYEQNKLDKIVYEFEIIYELIKENPTLLKYLSENEYTPKDHLSLFLEFDPLLLNFLKVCETNKVSRQLKYIFYDFKNLANKYQKVAFVKVFSAKQLTQVQLEKIKSNLEKVIPDKEIQINSKIDKSVLAGIKIIYQDKNLDYSIEKYLDDMFKEIGGNYGTFKC